MAYEGVALSINVKCETIQCFKCHVIFAVEIQTREHYLDTGDNFWCPNGHRQRYIESKIGKLEKQLKHKQKLLEWAEQDAVNARQDATNAKNSLRSEKGAKTKLKKRIANGVCPCCHRNFVNLGRHMTSQHPNFVNV